MPDLKEQLLKAGLVSEEQVRQAEHDKRRQEKKRTHRDKERRTDERRQAHDRDQAHRARADRERSRRENEQRQQRARRIADERQRRDVARQALERGRLPSWEGPRPYYFADGTRVEFLRVSEQAARRLEAGEAAIVRANGKRRYTLLTARAARELAEAEPERLVTLHGA